MPEINELIRKRSTLRREKKFSEADKVREEIEKLGYKVIDEISDSKIEKQEINKNIISEKSFLVIFGSGEISSIGRKAHEEVFRELNKKPIRISIVSTPAGFQPNVYGVHEEIADFFKTSLKNYAPEVKIIYANNKNDANNKELFSDLIKSDYIFIGPGSPTYAVDNFRDTLLLSAILRAVHNGKTLCLSSACVLAFSKFTLPVYEIYKVGTELHWKSGLNIFSRYLPEVNFIPHLNNNEGMPKLDTSFCFMGKDRFSKLKTLLPENEKLTGIDEQTALIINLKDKTRKIIGKGSVYEI